MKPDQNERRKGLNRRDFFKASARSAAVFAALSPKDVLAKVPKKRDAELDVIVMGAGGAGFAASIEAAGACWRDRAPKPCAMCARFRESWAIVHANEVY